MKGEKYKIVKGYKVFQLAISSDDPMDEPSEQHLFGWLRNRGYSEKEAGEIIKQVDENGESTITLP